ncbi:hypothetical protein Mal35_38670 [Gimesia maris]|uniref:beta strand repeat-containing protein n=1 Tax=Gimesia maris TaxID=122 RepID=UPI00118B5267|nr:VCBS domain-containing protein [Gimesia maris]QDT80396.1 hypothetical protein Mal35_38670 [Gimesia maris]
MKSLKRLFGRKSTRKVTRRLPFRIARPIGYASHVERLEDRTLLASNILASLESSVNQPNDTTELLLNISPGSSPTLGFEVHATAGSAFNPAAIQIISTSTNAVIPLNLAENDHAGTSNSLTLATLAPGEYSLLVHGQTAATGGFIVDVFLPGDTDGNGSVNDTEYQHALAASYQQMFGYNHYTTQFLIQQMGLNPNTNFYSQELDGDMDGDIDNYDLQMMNSNRNIPPIHLELIGDQDAPAVVAGLQLDSGISNSDGITNDLTIVGTVTDESLITQFKVSLDGGSFVNIFGQLSGGASGGSFTLTRGWLETNLNGGGSLEGGTHTLHFMTVDEHDNVSAAGVFNVNFELDTIAPATASGISDQNLGEDFTTVNLGALSTYFNQNGGTPLSFHVDSITDAIVNVDFSTGDLILNSVLNANGSTDIVIQAIDLAGNAVLSNTFTVAVNAVNDPPVAVNGDATASEDILKSFPAPGVLDFVTDVENDTLTVTEVNGSAGNVAIPVTIGAGGELNVAADGSFTFDPKGSYEYLAAGETDTETFTYTVSDGNGGTDTATVTITIQGANDAPVVSAAVTTTVSEDDANFNLDLLTSASDVDNGAVLDVDTLVNTLGDDGGISVNANGTSLDVDLSYYQYLSGSDTEVITYTYNVIDGLGGSVAQTVTITINGQNDDPTVSDPVATTVSEDDANFNLDLLTNASDVDNGASLDVSNITYQSGDDSGVTVNVNGTSLDVDLSFYQDLDAGDTEVITYTYNVIDGLGGSVAQTVTITINGQNDAPTVSAAVASVVSEDDANFNLDLLTNASDVDDSASLDVSNITYQSGDNSGVTVNANGTSLDVDLSFYQYLDAGDTEVITYTYNVIDGLGGSVAQTVTITINGQNDDPSVSATVTSEVSEDDANFNLNLLTNASDVDDSASLDVDSLSHQSGDNSGVTVNANGTSLDVDLSFYQDLDAGDTEVITYTYNVIDGLGGSVAQTVMITINGQNDAPTISAAVATTVSEDDANFNLDLLTNASDVDDSASLDVDNLSYQSGDNSGVTVNANGTSLDVDLSFYQDLDAGDTEVITYTYNVIDGLGGSVAQTVTITINGQNDDPSVSATVTSEVSEDDANFNLDLLTNASDVDDSASLDVDNLSYQSGDNSGVTVNANGTSLDVDLSFYQDLDAGDTEVITYTYNVIDGLGGSAAQTVTITINGQNDHPTVSATVASEVSEDDANFNLNLLTNASDVDDSASLDVDNLSYQSGDNSGVTVNANGTSLDVDLSFYQDLDAGDTEVITYTYNVIDGLGGSVAQTVTITINGQNDDPTISAAVATTVSEDDVNFNLDLLTNASDVDDSASLDVDNLSYQSGDNSGVSLNADGTSLDVDLSFYQDLDAGDTEVITYTYNVIDGLGGSVAQTVTITINGQNDHPTVSATVASEVSEDDADFNLDLLTNASDVDDGAVLNVSNIAYQSGDNSGVNVNVNGTSLDVDLSFYQDLDAGDTEVITYTYNVIDGLGGSVAQTVTITINGQNDAPTISAAVATTVSEDDANFNLDLLTNASDVDDSASLDVGSLSLQSGDDSGVSLNADGTSLDVDLSYYQYLSGSDTEVITYTYNVIDGLGGSVAQTVTITINGQNDDPIAVDDTVNVNKSNIYNGDVLADNGGGVDSDPDQLTTLTVTDILNPADDNSLGSIGAEVTLSSGAKLTMNGVGTFSYDPSSHVDIGDVVGTATITDSFKYTISDGDGGSSTALVTIIISANQPPVATVDMFATDEDTGLTNLDVLSNDSDPDGDDLTLDVTGLSGAFSTEGAAISLNPDNTVNYDPSGLLDHLSEGQVVVDTFTYTVVDVKGGVSVGTVQVTLTGRNDAPTISAAVASTVSEDDANFNLDLLTNASDVDNGAVLDVDSLSLQSGDDGGVSLNADGTSLDVDLSYYQYLAGGTSEVINYTYNVIDGLGGSVAQSVTITINGQNDDPTVSAAIISTVTEDDASYTLNLLTNASDVDVNASLSASGLTLDSNGDDRGVTFAFNSLEIDPSAYNYLAAGESEVLIYSYVVTDGYGGSTTQTATITINGVNDDPTVSAVVSTEVSEDDADFNLDLLTNASDVDNGASLDVSNIAYQSGDNSGVSVNADGTSLDVDLSFYQYLDAGDTEVITYTYNVIDGLGGSVAQTVMITINGQNDDPTISDPVATTVSEDDANFNLDLLTNASDVDDSASLDVDNLSYQSGDNSGVSVNADGTSLDVDLSFYQDLDAGDTEVIIYTYNVIDGLGGSVAQTVTITINGQNDDPTISDPVATTVSEDDADFNLNLLTNASDVDDSASLDVDNLSYQSGDNSGVSLNADGTSLDVDLSFYQDLDAGDTEVITYTYNVIDGLGGSVAQTVTITINGQNDDPTISAAVATTVSEDDADFNLDLLTNASDVDDSAVLDVSSLVNTLGDDGGVSVNANGTSLDVDLSYYQYLSGSDTEVITYTYNVIDGLGGSVAQSVTITINGQNDDPTISAAVTSTVSEDVVNFNLDLLANASDVDNGASLDVDSLTNTTGNIAGVSLNADGTSLDVDLSFYQDLDAGDTEVITYTYNVIDGLGGSVAQTVTITINGVNDDPTVSAVVSTEVSEDDANFNLDLLTNASDVDDSAVLDVSDIAYQSGDNSGVSVNADGTSLDVDLSFYQDLDAGDTEVITYTYNVIDGLGGSVAQTVTITINGQNDDPTISAAVTSTVSEDVVNFNLDLLANASDVDDSAVLDVDSLTNTTGNIAGVSLNADGTSLDVDLSFYQDLDAGDTEVITYTYNVIDGLGGSVAQTVTITINGQNDDPTVSATVASEVSEDDANFNLNLLTNASDVDDSASLDVSDIAYQSGDNSGVTVNANGTSLDVDLSFYQDLDAGDTEVITYTYNVIDGLGGSVAQTVTITINGQNDDPTISAAVATTVSEDDANFNLDLLTNASDVDDSASLDVSSLVNTLGDDGGVSVNANGTSLDVDLSYYQYLSGSDTEVITYTYNVIDGLGGSVAQSVTITINGQNDAPVVTDELDDISRDGLTPETIDLDLHFSEPDAGDSLTYTVEAHVLGDNPGDALPADFWANVAVAGSDLNITYTDYSSEQVRLPLVITVTAHSDDGASSDETSTFTLTPDPQATLDIRLIARDVESSGRDFTSFRSEADLAAIIAGGKGGARFQLTNGLQDLTYSISGLTDYNNANAGDGPIVDIQSDLVAVRIVDTTNSNITLFTLYHQTNSDDNPTVDFSAGTMTGVWASDDSTPFTSAILDKLYNGDLAVQVEITGLGKPKLSGKNILVSPEVDDVSNLPSSITQVVQDNYYVVEIWMSDMLAQVLASQTTETSNVSSVVLDMLWDVADASLIGYDFTIDSSAFGFLAGVDNADFNGGVLENINATTVLPGLITNGYGRIGYATFLADGAADSVDFTIDTTDLISGADGVTRGGNIDFSQISITNTSVDQVAPSEFFVQTDLSNLSVSGTITVDGQEINLLSQSAGLNSTSVSGRLDVVFDDINNPGTIQIVDSYIEVNPSGDARPDRDESEDYSILDPADFGLVGDQLIPNAFANFNGELNVAIRDAIAQVLSSQQAIDGSGNFDITEDWLLEHGQLDSMISIPDLSNTVADSNSEETFDQTMTFVDPVSGVPAGLTDWSHAKLTGNPTDGYVLLIPISRRVEFTTEDGYDIVLNLVGTATARFDVNQNDTDEAGDTITTAVDTELTSGAPGTMVYQGIIGNNGSLGDPNQDVDMFEVQLNVGDTVTVDVDADMFDSGLDSMLRLFDATGTPILTGMVDQLGDPVADADGVVDDVDEVPNEFIFDLGSLDSYFSFTATTAGTYYIGLSAFGQFDYDATTTGAGTGTVDPTLTGSYDLTITVENGGAPLHGTQSIVVDAPLEDGTAVDLVVVRNQTELGPNGHTLALPASDTWIDEWSSFWVEVYVETADARSITAAVADLNYNTSFFTATAIEFGSAFAATGEAVIDDATGVVTGLSGIANGDKTGYGKKALLARVKFESLAQDDVSIDFEDKFIGPHALGLSLSNVSVSLFNDTETSLVIGDAPDTDLWAIAYDVNDDDTINYRDLIILASVYGENVLDTNSPYVWALDADKSGTVNYKDLNFFASNYGVHKGGDKDVVYPSNFLQRWYGKTTDITGDSSVDQVMDEALAIWQDALGLEEAPDIQLVITNLGGTQLGEGQITGVDSEGRPVSGIVTLDDDAAGLGWYSGLDSTVFSSSELEGGVAYTADANSDAAGHYDLLTVLLHEIGHVLGFTKTYAPFESFVQAGVGETLTFVGSGFEATLTDDGLHLDDTVHAGDVMNATLDPGVRKLPSILDALILQSAHEAAASGSFEILVGVNAPLMANLPLVAEPSVTPVTESENSLVTVIAPLDELSPVVFDVTSSLQAGDEPVQHAWNQVINNLLQSQGLDQSDLDLTVLEGLSEELSNDLRFNGLSIVAGEKIDLSDLVDLESGDLDLAGLSEEIDADFDDVFSDWAGPIL